MKIFIPSLILSLFLVGCNLTSSTPDSKTTSIQTDDPPNESAEVMPSAVSEIQIEYLQSQTYPGSDLIIEETLAPGSNYQRYIASYQSEGLKQFGLLTVPNGEIPESGWPAIVFNHGYIDPAVYQTTERYIAYTDYFSRSGYVLFRPDYRGHANSEGEAQGGYGNSDYIIDVLNAFTSIQNYEDVDANRVGMWGHSMGGWITHRAM